MSAAGCRSPRAAAETRAVLRAMVLAAGLGTRLRPLTDWVPKPLAWLGDRPQIDHVLAALGRAGFERAVVNTHHLHEAFDDAWAARQSLPVDRVFEPSILGTAGGLHNARVLLGEGEVLLTNADIVADVDLGALADAHRRGGAEATVVVVAQKPGRPSTIALDAAGRVTRLRKETFGESVLEGDYAGIAILGDALRARLPAEGCLVGDVLLPWLREGAGPRRVRSPRALSRHRIARRLPRREPRLAGRPSVVRSPVGARVVGRDARAGGGGARRGRGWQRHAARRGRVAGGTRDGAPRASHRRSEGHRARAALRQCCRRLTSWRPGCGLPGSGPRTCRASCRRSEGGRRSRGWSWWRWSGAPR